MVDLSVIVQKIMYSVQMERNVWIFDKIFATTVFPEVHIIVLEVFVANQEGDTYLDKLVVALEEKRGGLRYVNHVLLLEPVRAES